MALRFLLAMAAVLALAATVQASDPELTTDFFIPQGVNKSNVTGEWFTSTILRNGSNVVPPAKFAGVRINSDSAPVLTGLGVSVALFRYQPGGINPPHTHPRGTEILYVLEGTLTVGLVDTTNQYYTAELQLGDVFVFPKGLVHYQINYGNTDALAYISFSSSNPGTISLPANLFGSGIPDDVLVMAFKVDTTVVDQLQSPFNVTA